MEKEVFRLKDLHANQAVYLASALARRLRHGIRNRIDEPVEVSEALNKLVDRAGSPDSPDYPPLCLLVPGAQACPPILANALCPDNNATAKGVWAFWDFVDFREPPNKVIRWLDECFKGGNGDSGRAILVGIPNRIVDRGMEHDLIEQIVRHVPNIPVISIDKKGVSQFDEQMREYRSELEPVSAIAAVARCFGVFQELLEKLRTLESIDTDFAREIYRETLFHTLGES